jgi:hypothetical protein
MILNSELNDKRGVRLMEDNRSPEKSTKQIQGREQTEQDQHAS